uniref:Uncharacterized protein n=1 Tax=Strombidium rassoulzadegani TaxID=1082188 RepID=A0A7S3CNH9_9SPIT|mmetsp:Transcript_18521/g.31702  ORF Transcript_18521/g.31702 Transcript_18521/m.31702 type:complete len:105 (+) Transcript_18521:712-1026(+)
MSLENPVVNPPFNNWSVNQPSVLHNSGMKGDEDLGLREIIIEGVNYDLTQIKASHAEAEEDEVITLQVHGVPVLVKPESIMQENSMNNYSFDNDIVVGLDDVKY